MKTPSALFGLGVLVWLLVMAITTIIGFFVVSEREFSVVFLWALQFWWIGFVIGVLAMLIAGMNKPKQLAPAFVSYLLPAVLMGLLVAIFLAVYPDPAFRDALLNLFPAALIFYVLAWLWATVRHKANPWPRLLFPPLFGGVALLVTTAANTFASNAFIYRDAFALQLVNLQQTDGKLIAKCRLEIKKAGNYDFFVPEVFDSEALILPGTHLEIQIAPEGKLIWSSGKAPASQSTGNFEFTVEWPIVGEWEGDVAALKNSFPLLLEVRNAAVSPPEFLISVPAYAVHQ